LIVCPTLWWINHFITHIILLWNHRLEAAKSKKQLIVKHHQLNKTQLGIYSFQSVITEMAGLLNTGLDRDVVALCISLCERGVNPEALAVRHNHSWHLLNITNMINRPSLKT
jgi:hypothetical protein